MLYRDMIQHISDYCNIKLVKLINLEEAYGYYSKERIKEMTDHLNTNILGDPHETMEWGKLILCGIRYLK